MKKKPLQSQSKLLAIESDKADLKRLGPKRGARLLFDILLINEFEHALLALKQDDCVWGPVHTSVGQEATAAATMLALRRSDKVAGTHRSHHHFLSKALHHVLPEVWSPGDGSLPAEGQDVVWRTMAEIMGLAPGYCGGRGGSMHLRWQEAGFLGSNAIVAGGIPLSVGAAFAEKRRRTGNVVACFFGDGASNQGAFHEAANLAAVWDLPVMFLVENNLYAVATKADEACAVTSLVERATSYGIPGYSVDGNDIVGLHDVVRQAADAMRDGGPPCLIEIRCYRRYHHAGDQPGSAYKYRSQEEEQEWAEKEVTVQFPRTLVEAGLLSEDQVAHIAEIARRAVASAVNSCVASRAPYAVRSELWPKPDTIALGVRSAGTEWKGVQFREREDFETFASMKYSDAIAAVTGRWLEQDPEAFVLGEEVANFGGGAYGATKGLPTKYPERVLNTPISEAGFIGLALGAAMSGMRPVAEIMFPDFALVAADQLFNQIGKARHMYGDTTDLPLVARTRIAIGCGYGGQHSMDPVGLYALFPGWRIVAPTDAFDYIGLFNSAMRSLDPVIVLEHHSLYGRKSAVPQDDLDYCIPFGKARVVCEGADVTVLAYCSMVSRCEALCARWEAEGVSAELVDLRTLDFPSIDYVTIGRSVKKTGAVVIVEQAPASISLGGRLAAEITERFFDYLDGPVARVSSADVPNPVSRVLESAAMVSDDEIAATTAAVARRAWK